AEGDRVRPGQQLLVMEAMKMEHVVQAETSGVVRAITVARGDTIGAGHVLVHLEPEHADGPSGSDGRREDVDLDEVRPDLAEVLDRHRLTLDAARPEAVERRRRTGQRTARENLEALCDEGTFVEYA